MAWLCLKVTTTIDLHVCVDATDLHPYICLTAMHPPELCVQTHETKIHDAWRMSGKVQPPATASSEAWGCKTSVHQDLNV